MLLCALHFSFIKGMKWSKARVVEREKCISAVRLWGLSLNFTSGHSNFTVEFRRQKPVHVASGLTMIYTCLCWVTEPAIDGCDSDKVLSCLNLKGSYIIRRFPLSSSFVAHSDERLDKRHYESQLNITSLKSWLEPRQKRCLSINESKNRMNPYLRWSLSFQWPVVTSLFTTKILDIWNTWQTSEPTVWRHK